ncbi:hypothetical protein L6R49_19810 [Myxococcota bacterium]|nr:hypothetical protein [Myxococcota bacterium]
MRAFALLLVPSIALAQESTPEVPPAGFQYAERTVIEFEKDLAVEGELVGPEGESIFERRSASFSSMIRLRADFNPELADSAQQIR